MESNSQKSEDAGRLIPTTYSKDQLRALNMQLGAGLDKSGLTRLGFSTKKKLEVDKISAAGRLQQQVRTTAVVVGCPISGPGFYRQKC